MAKEDVAPFAAEMLKIMSEKESPNYMSDIRDSPSVELHYNLRGDLLPFAEQMSLVMNEKQGSAPRPASWTGCMNEIQKQLKKFEQTPFPTVEETQRILVHIANWSAIAWRILEEDKR